MTAVVVTPSFGRSREAVAKASNEEMEIVVLPQVRAHLKRQQNLLDNIYTMVEEINEQWADLHGAATRQSKDQRAAKLSRSDVIRLESVVRRLDPKYRPKPPFRVGMDGDVAHANVDEAMEGVMMQLDPGPDDQREKDVVTAQRRRQTYNDEEVSDAELEDWLGLAA